MVDNGEMIQLLVDVQAAGESSDRLDKFLEISGNLDPDAIPNRVEGFLLLKEAYHSPVARALPGWRSVAARSINEFNADVRHRSRSLGWLAFGSIGD